MGREMEENVNTRFGKMEEKVNTRFGDLEHKMTEAEVQIEMMNKNNLEIQYQVNLLRKIVSENSKEIVNILEQIHNGSKLVISKSYFIMLSSFLIVIYF